MNILYITQYFSSASGGGEVVFYVWAEQMVKRGHNVDVICHQIANFDERQLPGVNIYRVKPTVEHKGGLPPSMTQNIKYMINALLNGSHLIRNNKIDIIHTNTFSPIIVGSILSKIHEIPVVATVHDVFTTASPDYWMKWASQNKVSRIYSKIGSLFEKITLSVPTDIILTSSNATKQDLVKFKVRPSKIKVIPNGINLTYYDILDIDKDYHNYVIFIGRLVFYKNLDVVIYSFKEISQKLPEAKLLVVGDGPMRNGWERKVSELDLNKNIVFTGHVPEKKKIELLSKCSALLLPSIYEGFGLVLLEAFAMSKPVLVANTSPYDEIVDEGVDGFMVPAHDPNKWAEKILFLLSNKTICREMGNNGRLKAEKKFSIHDVVDHIESLYIDLQSQKRIKKD